LNYEEAKIWNKILKPFLADGNLLRRNNHHAKAHPRSRCTLVLGLEQLHQFPLGKHDDGPDALEMAIQVARYKLGRVYVYSD
jgi:hypothetical protein